ncbi:TonB-dependent receptor [Aureisphaera galaxeae]|uniref:TonB-dependent receptor plug domain-containing protein n=1 Tax=Aureisphaera galaxeae TaxID=1538023 RepID=UPI002350704E|nr:TonB-dependent receptor plug domain-containing protein [Aureisphaera galaxeae]MDC8005520.1 TonB-dependent receptor [Aureisphaera galaxeae]
MAQNTVGLRDYLENLESSYPYTFSFKDEDISSHYVTNPNASSFENALDFLGKNTLFQYRVLPDNTITISRKENLVSICGKVFNDVDGLPFTSVAVMSPYQQVLTDAEGLFSMDILNLGDAINFQYTGYEKVTRSASDFTGPSCGQITLSPRIEVLNPVNLTNYFAKGISKNNDGTLTVNYDEFDILPGLIEPDVLLTIQALPGIQSVNESVSFLNIRGGTNDQNLILWDGIKMYQNGHFFGLISAFNPFLTENVTVTKNGTSALFGDGVSGVISMEGDDEITSKVKGSLGLNLISADAFVDVPLGKIGSVQVSGRKSINNIVETPTYTSYFERAFQNTEVTSMGGDVLPNSDDDFSFLDTSFRVLLKPTEKDLFRFNFMVLANELEFLENARIDGEFQSLRSDLLQNNVSGGFYYQRQWNDRWNTDFQFYGTAYELQASNQDVVNNQRLFQENDVLESGARLTTDHRFSDKIMGRLGYQFNETGITNFEQINNPFFERTDKQVIRTHSFFAESNIQALKNTAINAGLRLNHVGKFNELLWEPRLSLTHRFLNYFTFELLGELKSQTTSQIIDFQNDFLGVENRRWVLSRPNDIPIIKSQQVSAGLTFSRKGWLVNVEPYLKKVEGITSQSQGFQNQFVNERSHGSYIAKGIDVLLNKNFKSITTWLSYSYAKNDYEFEDFIPSEFPNNLDIRHTLSYGINYSFKNFNLSGGFNWHTGKPTTLLARGEEIVDGALNFARPNGENIKDYFRVDISGTYEFKLSNSFDAFVGASIWNLLDTDNVVNHFFRLSDDMEVEEIDEFALGFTPNFSFRIIF